MLVLNCAHYYNNYPLSALPLNNYETTAHLLNSNKNAQTQWVYTFQSPMHLQGTELQLFYNAKSQFLSIFHDGKDCFDYYNSKHKKKILRFSKTRHFNLFHVWC